MRGRQACGLWLLLVAAPPLAAANAGLFGDWGGARSALAARGIEMKAEYTSESATNIAGGEHRRARETGQLTLGATIDLGQLAGIENGTLQTTVSWRRGEDLGAAAGLGVLQQVQEVYGRGQTWRLTQLWYEHQFSNTAIKLGRMIVGEDFAAFSCQFQNLTFCGAQPGNIVGDYWYNWPVSQWGARLKQTQEWGYAQIGVYEVNPRNLDNQFILGHSSGATGVLTPVEIAWQPRLGKARQWGSFRFGGWHDSSAADDVYRDQWRQPRRITGLDALERSGRYGLYINLEQQISGERQDGEALSGVTLFLNAARADDRTATIDSQIAAGLFVTGPLPHRPHDRIGIGAGRTHVNHRADWAEADATGERPHAEHTVELFYRMQVTSWLTLAPNLQVIHHPGGFEHRSEVVVIGLKAALAL